MKLIGMCTAWQEYVIPNTNTGNMLAAFFATPVSAKDNHINGISVTLNQKMGHENIFYPRIDRKYKIKVVIEEIEEVEASDNG